MPGWPGQPLSSVQPTDGGTKESEREITSRKGEENKQKVEVIRMVLVLIFAVL